MVLFPTRGARLSCPCNPANTHSEQGLPGESTERFTLDPHRGREAPTCTERTRKDSKPLRSASLKQRSRHTPSYPAFEVGLSVLVLGGEHGEAGTYPSLSPQLSVVPSTSPLNAAAWASVASLESPVKMPIAREGTHSEPFAQVGLQSHLDNTK